MEVSKTNNRNDLIDMQRKISYTKQAIVKYAVLWKHEDYQQLGSVDQNGRQYEAKQVIVFTQWSQTDQTGKQWIHEDKQ